MALKLTSLSELSPSLVAQTQAELTQLMNERHPEVELSVGVFHDLIAYFAGGVAGAINQTEINRVMEGNSLLAIEENPLLADEEIVDRTLSNYMVTRKDGATSTGEITIIVTDNTTLVIGSGTTFTANGVIFNVDDAFTVRPPGSVLQGANERLLEALGDGTFSFTITATADDAGFAGNLPFGTGMVPDPIFARFVRAFSASDFAGGADVELNSDLINRLQEGVAAKVLNGRVNIKALFRDQDQFSESLHYSIIGFGNPEMERDQHWIWPISGGGRLDIYARTQPTPKIVSVTKTATLVATSEGHGVWQFSIDKDDAPGFYEVAQITKVTENPSDVGGFEITMDLRGFDLSGNGFLPDLLTAEEAAYTRYQTAVIRFIDTDTSIDMLTVGTATADYTVAISAMPQIAELQEFINDHDIRHLASDVVMKGAVPCNVSISCDIEQGPDETAPDLDAIANDIAATINAMDFPGQLHASIVSDVIHNYLTSRQAVGRITLQGNIRKPSGESIVIRDNHVLEIPESPGDLTTGRTTAFFVEAGDVGLAVVTKGFEENT